MGDVRFRRHLERLREAAQRRETLDQMADHEVVEALAAASHAQDPLLANVLATEATNRLRRKSAIVDNAAEGLLALDGRGLVVSMNPAAEELLGWREPELKGRPFHAAVHYEREDGTPFPEEECPVVRASKGHGETRGARTSYLRRDGTRFAAEVSSMPIHRDGEVVGCVVSLRDVGERVRAEAQNARLLDALDRERAQLRAVLEQMPSGVAIAEAPSGRLLYHNQEAIRILGHPLLRSDSYRDYVQYGALHADRTPYRPEEYPIARAAVHGETIHDHEMLYRRGDGATIRLRVSAAPVCDEQGRQVAAVATFQEAGEPEPEAAPERG